MAKIKCTRCKAWKEPEQFALAPRMSRGRHSWCKSCMSEYNRAKNQALTPEQREERNRRRRESGAGAASARRSRAERPDIQRFATIKYRYGITREQWEAKFEEQRGICAISACARPATHIDHDHRCCPGTKPVRACGKCFRALVCGPCNFALGNVQDDPELLRSLADYIDGQRLKDVLV